MLEAFKSFLSKYAGEVLSIAEALNTTVGGIALSNADRAVVQEVIDKLQAAASSILGGIDNIKATEVKISKADITAACKPIIDGLVNDAIKVALANMEPPVLPDLTPAIASAVEAYMTKVKEDGK